MIQVKDLQFTYGERTVLDNISFDIKKGEFVALLGHNGSGKSTLAKHFNGLLTPSSGSVIVDHFDTRDQDTIFNVRQRVGMVFQNPDNQIVASIVEEDVAFAPENLCVPSAEIRDRVEKALLAVDMLEFRKHAPHNLSGGQKQRVAIAGVIAMRPKYLVLDEPTAMLDPKGRNEVMDTLLNLNKTKGITVILVTHFMEEAVLADRVMVMNNGSVFMDGVPIDVFSQVERLRSASLDVPDVTALMYELKRCNLPVNQKVLTADQCAKELISLLGVLS